MPPNYSRHYSKLLVMAGVSFGVMYCLMYAMVNAWANVYSSVNQFYMAGLMAAPMVVIELVVMRVMYNNRRLNAVLGAVSVGVTMLFFLLIRQQTAVSDKQFLRSMIPHHAGAILMCQQASLHDQDIQELCRTIISSQQSEINWMKTKLRSLE